MSWRVGREVRVDTRWIPSAACRARRNRSTLEVSHRTFSRGAVGMYCIRRGVSCSAASEQGRKTYPRFSVPSWHGDEAGKYG